MSQNKVSYKDHEFSFTEASVSYSDSKITRYVSFDQPLKIIFSWKSQLILKGKESIPLHLLPKDMQKDFFLGLVRAWMRRNSEAARKAIFDFTDAQKGFVGLALGVSLILLLPMTVGFLNDSREQYQCTKVLHADSAVGEMLVTKAKKKRKGHYLLELQLTTPEGVVVTGTDQLITEDETSIPKSVPVVYSPKNPNCWSLTPGLQGHEVNWAKRRYFAVFTLLFGSFFLMMTIWGLSWSIIRLLQKRPYIQELIEISRG